MENLPPRFQQAINANVDQSFNDAFEDHIPVGLELMIHNALAASLPQLLAPINETLTRIETKMTHMETRMESKLTNVQITLAKVTIPIHICCIILNVGL